MLIRVLLASVVGVSTAFLALVLSSCAQPPQTIEVTRTVEVTVEVPRSVAMPVTVEVEHVVTHEVEVTREVPVTVEVEREVTREVEVMREVPVTVEVEREVTREVEVMREVLVTVEVEREVTREVEVMREVPVTVEVEREVIREVEVTATPTATLTPTPTTTPMPPPANPEELVERVRQGIVRVEGSRTQGSGFIFDIEETTAFIVTNHHVIEGADTVDVLTWNSQTYEALVLGWDADRDVAVISICCSYDFQAIPWPKASTSEGDEVVAIGFPSGSGNDLAVTIGEVVASDSASMQRGFIPHSAPLNPGNSGGPLFAMPGAEVVGINTARGTEVATFYAVPFQAIEEQVADWRSQLVILPAATPTPVVTFEGVEVDGAVYTLRAFRDPVPIDPDSWSGPDPGERIVAIDVEIAALKDDVSYSRTDFVVQDSHGYIYERSSSGMEPGLGSGTLLRGQRVRGWVNFHVPAGAAVTTILVEAGGLFSSRRYIIADIRP